MLLNLWNDSIQYKGKKTTDFKSNKLFLLQDHVSQVKQFYSTLEW